MDQAGGYQQKDIFTLPWLGEIMIMSKPVLSIIIPCYNSGKYLPEALDSITTYPDKSTYEVIIINDGSTDAETISLLNDLPAQGFHVIHQENLGPAAARNAGVKAAKGQYLLLLDSDNKIEPEYISQGIDILSNQPDISIVHANPVFFGDTDQPRFNTGKFNLAKILKENYIDTCTVIRKTTWEVLGGQDEDRRIAGHADWEFWIRAGGAGYRFYYIDKPLYHYRVLNNSLVSQYIGEGMHGPVYSYVYGKHALLIAENYNGLYNNAAYGEKDQQRPFRSFFKHLYNLYFNRSK
jgi:glycosyltransferase involved in cell wall biosynthesis